MKPWERVQEVAAGVQLAAARLVRYRQWEAGQDDARWYRDEVGHPADYPEGWADSIGGTATLEAAQDWTGLLVAVGLLALVGLMALAWWRR